MSRDSSNGHAGQVEYEDRSDATREFDDAPDTEPGRPQRVTVNAMLVEIRGLSRAVRDLRSVVKWSIAGSVVSALAVATLCAIVWWTR